jgi:DNA-binding transcriptional regulator LsrR (DeoR family)
MTASALSTLQVINTVLYTIVTADAVLKGISNMINKKESENREFTKEEVEAIQDLFQNAVKKLEDAVNKTA